MAAVLGSGRGRRAGVRGLEPPAVRDAVQGVGCALWADCSMPALSTVGVRAGGGMADLPKVYFSGR